MSADSPESSPIQRVFAYFRSIRIWRLKLHWGYPPDAISSPQGEVCGLSVFCCPHSLT